jgi:hypothetical protein
MGIATTNDNCTHSTHCETADLCFSNRYERIRKKKPFLFVIHSVGKNKAGKCVCVGGGGKGREEKKRKKEKEVHTYWRAMSMAQ